MYIKLENKPFVTQAPSGLLITTDWCVYEREHWWNKWTLVRSFQHQATAFTFAKMLKYPVKVSL